MYNYSYSYDYVPGLTGVGIATYIVSMLVAVAAIVAMWRIFSKAGEPGWAAIVPLYNTYVLFKITWGNGWNFLLMLIPLANIVIGIVTIAKLAKVFGKGGGFAAGLIFLGPIFMMILAFGSAQYVGLGTTAAYQSYAPPAAQPAPAARPVPVAAPQQSAGTESWQCACGAWSTGNFCVACGAKKPESPKRRYCAGCGNLLSGDEKFCGRCGAPLE